MTIFEHLSTLMSFIMSLAMVTLAVFLAKLLRHRSRVVWSVPHALWMVNILLAQVLMWLSVYELRLVRETTAVSVLFAVLMPLLLFLQAEMVAPADAQPEDLDLRAFHQRYGTRYIAIGVVYGLLHLVFLGWIAWRNHTAYPLHEAAPMAIMLAASMVAMVARALWVQVLVPLSQVMMQLLGLQAIAAGMAQ